MTRQNQRRDERDLQREIADLKRRIKALETSPRVGNASVSHGKFLVRDSSGTTDVDVIRFGYLGQYSGTDVRGTEMRRPTGELVLSTWSGTDQGRFWGMYDVAENRIISDDVTSGQGLATPYLGSALFAPGDRSKWPSVTASSYTTQWYAQWYKQHPRLLVQVWTQTDSGTSGDIRVNCNGVSTSQSVPSADNEIKNLYLTVPGAHLDNFQITVDLRRTAGTGFMGCWPMACYGVQS